MKEQNENIRVRVLSLIESEFESDAAFERALGLADKTVNNWRRGRSASYMKMLPELSLEEVHLLHLYRKARVVPPKMRSALRETLESIINLYIESAQELKGDEKKKKAAKKQQ